MMSTTKPKKKYLANFRIDHDTWEEFKRLTEQDHTDSSKQLRKMIDRYIKDRKLKFSKL